MNRDEALAWLVENVDDWPLHRKDSPIGWFWSCAKGKCSLVKLVSFHSAERCITKADWLAAKQGIDTTTSPSNN